MVKAAIQSLRSSAYTVSHNDPFMGGFITREYGKPSENQQALQLEMTKVNYMDDTETRYDENRAEKMKILLKGTLSTLAGLLTNKVKRNQ